MSDVFRKEYRQLNPNQQNQISLVKSKADELLMLIQQNCNPENLEEMEWAIKDLRQSVMWAINGITA